MGEVFQLAQEGDEKAAEVVVEMNGSGQNVCEYRLRYQSPERFVLGGGCMEVRGLLFWTYDRTLSEVGSWIA